MLIVDPLRAVRPSALNALMEAISMAAQGITDTAGRRVLISTIDERSLRTAALTAIMIATGDVVWPGDRPLDVRNEHIETGSLVRSR